MTSELKREYHGCEIISLPIGEADFESDGWSHQVVGPSGEEIGTFKTLGLAIKAAKENKSVEASKQAKETANEVEETPDNEGIDE